MAKFIELVFNYDKRSELSAPENLHELDTIVGASC